MHEYDTFSSAGRKSCSARASADVKREDRNDRMYCLHLASSEVLGVLLRWLRTIQSAGGYAGANVIKFSSTIHNTCYAPNYFVLSLRVNTRGRESVLWQPCPQSWIFPFRMTGRWGRFWHNYNLRVGCEVHQWLGEGLREQSRGTLSFKHALQLDHKSDQYVKTGSWT